MKRAFGMFLMAGVLALAPVMAFADEDNESYVTQYGDSNSATVDQTGFQNKAYIDQGTDAQHGHFNQATQTQIGGTRT